MKIISVTPGEYEEILTDEKPEGSNIYRRMASGVWVHWLGMTHQWLCLFDPEQLEEAYQAWKHQEKKKISQ